jgi:hypothetical protein
METNGIRRTALHPHRYIDGIPVHSTGAPAAAAADAAVAAA